MFGIIAEKLGMTQIFDENGALIPVTVLSVRPNTVVSVCTPEKHSYNAVQLGYREQKEHRISKALKGHFKAAKTKNFAVLREFRTDRSSEFGVGTEIKASVFQVGDQLKVQGVSKGKGFQGVMKRYNFAGGCDSHGNSVSHRVPGSIGQCTFPGRVIPGKKMPGHMGSEKVSVKNIKVVGVEAEQGLILVKGPVPGHKGSVINLYPQTKGFEDRILNADPGKTEEQGAA